MGLHAKLVAILYISLFMTIRLTGQKLNPRFADPPAEFSVMPFWFWNDTLRDDEIVRQIADFESHGVYGFVIHPRIGLPEDIKWLDDRMIHAMKTAIEEAGRRQMYVILYDEGMYPSGSSSGQVVARNPDHAAHGLAKIDLKEGEDLKLPEGSVHITTVTRPSGDKVAVIQKKSGGIIRGLHYIGEGTTGRLREESPPAGDILNPGAVASYIELVYEKYAEEFGSFFGNTILGIFTDEPDPLGRSSARGIMPGNKALIPQINSILGYDITPFLADLWYNDFPESEKRRAEYRSAINRCLELNYYKRLGDWCSDHGISLVGHPAGSMDIGAEKYFQIPGQDLVWRYVEPGIKALTGQHSTMAKCASSAMIHLGYRRNANELYGAYGHNLTWDEMLWLANWCFVRGQNLLIPHAFYYSIRGPRFDERPPDVGPHSDWWDRYRPYADACSRLSWLNTDSKQICEVAVLADPTFLPWNAARTLYTNQIDFNYLEFRLLGEEAVISKGGIALKEMKYKVLILDSLEYLPEDIYPLLRKLADNKRLILYGSKYADKIKNAIVAENSAALKTALKTIINPDISLSPPSEAIRYRHIEKEGDGYYMLFNEDNKEVRTKISLDPKEGITEWVDQYTGTVTESVSNEEVVFKPYEMKLLLIKGNK